MLTRHHCYPTSKGGTNHPDNITMLGQKFHQRLHGVFNNQLPHEQLNTVLEIATTTFQRKFRREIESLLKDYEGGMYKPEVYRKENGIWR